MAGRFSWVVIFLAFGLAACGLQSHRAGGDSGFRTDLASSDVHPWTSAGFHNGGDNLHFAIVSDRTGGARAGVFEQAAKNLNLLDPEFVICVGDLIEGYSKDRTIIEKQRTEFDSIVNSLDMRFFFIPGNHDIETEPGRTIWRERYGQTYYSFVYKNVLFLCVDSIAEGSDPPISNKEIDYFRQVLDENPNVRWTFVFLHIPLWADPSAVQEKTGWAAFDALLRDRPCTVFAGHYHTYMMHERDGRKLYRLATTGGSTNQSGLDAGVFDQIVWVTMDDAAPNVVNLDLNGIYDETLVTEASEKLRSSFGMYPSPILGTDPLFKTGSAELTLSNHAELPAQVNLDIKGSRLLSVEPRQIEIEVPPKSSQTLTLTLTSALPVKAGYLEPITLAGTARYDRTESGPVEKKLASSMRILDATYECPRAGKPVTVDGSLDEWPDLPYSCDTSDQVAYHSDEWGGPDDASFRFGVQRDDRFVYLAIRATDDVFAFDLHDPENVFYSYDGMNVSFDVAPGGTPPTGMSRDVDSGLLRTWITPEEPGREMVLFPANMKAFPHDASVKSVRTPDGYSVEMAVPIVYLERYQATPWKAFQVNVQMVDADQLGPHTPSILWWRPETTEGAGDCGTGEAFVSR